MNNDNQEEIPENEMILYLEFIMYIMSFMCLIIFEERAKVQDQYLLSLNPVQKADDPIQDRNRSMMSIDARNHH